MTEPTRRSHTTHTAPLLVSVEDLHLSYATPAGRVHAVQGATLQVREGQSVAVVGESGAGKSTLAKALIGLLPERATTIESGRIVVAGRDVTRLGAAQWPQVRGSDVAMVFQDTLSFLNPVMRIGKQIAEAVRLRDPGADVAARVDELVERVRLPRQVVRSYPLELSGGMRQRVGIAIALGCRPKLLIADEPTTALDVTTQAEILVLLAELCRSQGMALLLISHDLGVVRSLCDTVYLMYSGRVVESGSAGEVFETPAHPYVRGLGAAARDVRAASGRFSMIPGEVPDLKQRIAGCPFAPRCSSALDECAEEMPAEVTLGAGRHAVRCWLHGGR